MVVVESWIMAGIGSLVGDGAAKVEAICRRGITNMWFLGHMQLTSFFIMVFLPVVFQL
jgi:hypothetical protein